MAMTTRRATVTRAGTRAMCFGAVREVRYLHLYANDVEPSADDPEGKRFRELVGGGYSPRALAVEDWTLADQADHVLATYPEQAWRFTDAVGAVYGYYVTGASGTVLWAERFELAPLLVRGPGDEIRLGVSLQVDRP